MGKLHNEVWWPEKRSKKDYLDQLGISVYNIYPMEPSKENGDAAQRLEGDQKKKNQSSKTHKAKS